MFKLNPLLSSVIKRTQHQTSPLTPRPASPPTSLGGWPKNDLFTTGGLGRGLLQPLPLVAPRPQLSEAQRSLLARLDHGPASERALLDQLRGAAGFKRLDEDTQVRVLQQFLGDSMALNRTPGQRLDDAVALVSLIKSPGFAALPAGQHTFCLGAFDRAGTEGKRALAALAEQLVDGQPALASRDSLGITLATRLALLSTSQAGQPFLDSTLKELADPGSIGAAVNAQTRATQQRLARENPAELVRILEELVTRGASTLADGKTRLDVKPAFIADFRPLPLAGSSPSAGLFQRLASDQDPRAFFGG